MVDIASTRYAIARRYMIRLRRDDFEDPHELAKLAATANLTRGGVPAEFEYLVAAEPPRARDGRTRRAGRNSHTLTAARAPRMARRGRTMPWMRSLSLVLLALAASRSAAAVAAQVESPARTVYVTVTDKVGGAVPDLGPADFIVKIGGKQREVVPWSRQRRRSKSR